MSAVQPFHAVRARDRRTFHPREYIQLHLLHRHPHRHHRHHRRLRLHHHPPECGRQFAKQHRQMLFISVQNIHVIVTQLT